MDCYLKHALHIHGKELFFLKLLLSFSTEKKSCCLKHALHVHGEELFLFFLLKLLLKKKKGKKKSYLKHALHVHSKELFLGLRENSKGYPEDDLHPIHQETVHHPTRSP